MTPPNITKGEWTVAAESGQWWVTDQDYQELPETEENARFLSSSKTMAEALLIVCACGEPEKTSLYDEEGVEGWKWTHPDGREWTCIGDWNESAPMHPVAHAALLLAGYTE